MPLQLQLYPWPPKPSRIFNDFSAGESIINSRGRYYAKAGRKNLKGAPSRLLEQVADIAKGRGIELYGLCFVGLDRLALGPLEPEKRYSMDQARRLVRRLEAKRRWVPCGFGPKRTICYAVFAAPVAAMVAQLVRDLFHVAKEQEPAPHLRLVPLDAQPCTESPDFDASASDFCKGTPCRSASQSLIVDRIQASPIMTKTQTRSEPAGATSSAEQSRPAVSVGVLTCFSPEKMTESSATGRPKLTVAAGLPTITVGDELAHRRRIIHYRQKAWKTCECQGCETCALQNQVLDAKARHRLSSSFVEAYRDRSGPEHDRELMRTLLAGVAAVMRSYAGRTTPRNVAATIARAIAEDWSGNYQRQDEARRARIAAPPLEARAAPAAPPAPPTPSWPDAWRDMRERVVNSLVASGKTGAEATRGWLDGLGAAVAVAGSTLTLRPSHRTFAEHLRELRPEIWRAVFDAAPSGLLVEVGPSLDEGP